ncbi:MAG: TolC family protein [Bacteroidetes bacterium]|uniref:TolC family protein n=1 Tax=Candidatus Merdivivens pullicola TaxID=2840872 RepID=A0A9D9NGQ3_9BACT|nr:TolC family protein [Candidatus Merdivivens pullicola]
MKKILLFCTFVAVPYICCSQEIDTVMSRIERNNLELQALRESNKASMLEIKAENNIQQDLSVSYSPFFSNGVRGVASSEFVASLGFDFPTQYAARKKWGDYRSEEIGRQYLLQRRDILLEAKKLCLEIIRLDAEKEILDTRLENADELLALVEKKFEEGGAGILEMNKVKMERMTIRTLAAQNSASRRSAIQNLEALNGGISLEIAASMEYPVLPALPDFDAFCKHIAESDLSVLSAGASVEATAQEIKVNRQNWLPKLEVGYRRNTSLNEASDGFIVGISVPLFSGKNKVKIAKARHTAAIAGLENARLQSINEMRSSYFEMTELAQALEEYDLPLMLNTLEALKKAVTAGQISIMDYYMEADNIFNSLADYIGIENRYQVLMAELFRNEL